MSSFLPQKAPDAQKLAVSFDCMRVGRFAEASLILDEMRNAERADILFARGLCSFRAKIFDTAAGYFEQALTAHKKASGTFAAIRKTDQYKLLRKTEIEENCYLQPMDISYIETFPEAAKENMILAAAFSYLHGGNIESAKKLVNSLSGEEFDAVKAKVN